MSRYRIEILVTPRPGLLDPEGNAVHHALQSLGYVKVESAGQGDLPGRGRPQAREKADAMCRKVLANPVTEDYQIQVMAADTVEGVGSAAPSPAGSARGSGEASGDGAREESS